MKITKSQVSHQQKSEESEEKTTFWGNWCFMCWKTSNMTKTVMASTRLRRVTLLTAPDVAGSGIVFTSMTTKLENASTVLNRCWGLLM